MRLALRCSQLINCRVLEEFFVEGAHIRHGRQTALAEFVMRKRRSSGAVRIVILQTNLLARHVLVRVEGVCSWSETEGLELLGGLLLLLLLLRVPLDCLLVRNYVF